MRVISTQTGMSVLMQMLGAAVLWGGGALCPGWTGLIISFEVLVMLANSATNYTDFWGMQPL